MLEFFRRYQRFFLMIITVVIVISFSFFGTYDAFVGGKHSDPVVFKTVDGSSVTQSEIDEMMAFIGTDAHDKLAFGGMIGPNFLNDGVIRKDILETGLADVLLEKYATDLHDELQQRLDKEKRFNPYVHPQAKFLSAESGWAYFAPDIKANFDRLKTFSDGTLPEAFKTRVALFLGEKRFPAYALHRVLRYQESQYKGLAADPDLDGADLFLYGHHTLEDWFGRQFVNLSAKTIMNGARIAEKRGYIVTKEEALASLLQNADVMYNQLKNQMNLAPSGSVAFMQDQLRRMNMDTGRAVKIWREVLLFRRLFKDVGNATLVDSLSYNKFNEYAKESVTVDLYQLPKEFRLHDFDTLQKLEVYLAAVAKKNSDSSPLALPTTYLSAAEVAKNYPELVQKYYKLEIAGYNKASLQAKVALKETWAWEVQDANWKKLQEKFPDLGVAKASSVSERFAVLEKLDDVTRAQIDAIARVSIVEAHPEWLQESLEATIPVESDVNIRLAGGILPLQGVTNRQELIRLLDSAPLAKKGEVAPWINYKGDGSFEYRLRVLERGDKTEVLSFAEALRDGTLDALVTRVVKNEDAERYFDKVIQAVYQDAVSSSGKEEAPKTASGDFAARNRFAKYMRDTKATLEKQPGLVDTVLKGNSQELTDQFKLVQQEKKNDRTDLNDAYGLDKAFLLSIGQWSSLSTPPNGDLSFFSLKNKGIDKDPIEIGRKMEEAHLLLGFEAERQLLREILQ